MEYITSPNLYSYLALTYAVGFVLFAAHKYWWVARNISDKPPQLFVFTAAAFWPFWVVWATVKGILKFFRKKS